MKTYCVKYRYLDGNGIQVWEKQIVELVEAYAPQQAIDQLKALRSENANFTLIDIHEV